MEPNPDSQHCMTTLYSRRSNLYLEAGDITYSEAENAAQRHQEPKVQAGLVLKAGDNWQLTKDQHHGHEQDAGIHIVVEG